jgi:hypothetical protein
MKRLVIRIAVVGGALIVFIAAFVLYILVSGRYFNTPEVSLSELTSQENCGKASVVKGKVLRYISDHSYEIEQNGTKISIILDNKGKAPRMPGLGKTITANVGVMCQNGVAFAVIGTSFSEAP